MVNWKYRRHLAVNLNGRTVLTYLCYCTQSWNVTLQRCRNGRHGGSGFRFKGPDSLEIITLPWL